MEGFIRLHRKFFKGAYWNQKRTYSPAEAWLDLIFMARFDAEPTTDMLTNGREITIKRGEMRASLRFLSERWCWGVEKTQRFINRHIEKREIERRTEQGESIIILCNYERYNPLTNIRPNTDQDTDQYTGRTPTSTNNKKDKKEKKGYNNPPIIPHGEYDEFSFINFWNLYDKKVGEIERIRKKWENLSAHERDLIMQYIPRYKQAQPDKQYRKNPSTFLNQKSWNDELVQRAKPDFDNSKTYF